mgnify:CR=1 FL=1
MTNVTKRHHCQVTRTYNKRQRFIFQIIGDVLVKFYIMELETILITSPIDQPQPNGLIKQVFKLMRICFAFIGIIASYYGVLYTHASIGYGPLILIYYFSWQNTSKHISIK